MTYMAQYSQSNVTVIDMAQYSQWNMMTDMAQYSQGNMTVRNDPIFTG